MEFSFSRHGPKGRGLCTGGSALTAHDGEHRRMNENEFFFSWFAPSCELISPKSTKPIPIPISRGSSYWLLGLRYWKSVLCSSLFHSKQIFHFWRDKKGILSSSLVQYAFSFARRLLGTLPG